MTAAKRATSAQPVRPVCAVVGPEEFLKSEAIRDITDRVLGDADRRLALSEFDAGGKDPPELATVLDELRTPPFLAPRRLVILRDADAFITQYRKNLEDYVENPSSVGVLVIECASLPLSTRLGKRIQAVGQVIKCDQIKRWDLESWLVTRCRDLFGLRLEQEAASRLAELVGNDAGLLAGELHKLSLYVGDRKAVTVDDVKKLVGHTREEEIWEIVSAVGAGDTRRAVTQWEEVWQTNPKAEYLSIAGLASKVRGFLDAKRAQAAGAPIDQLCRLAKIFENRARVERELDAFGVPELEQMLCRLVEADAAAKSSQGDVRSLVEAFIVGSRIARRRR